MDKKHGQTRLMSGIIILAFPMMLVGYLLFTRYGFDVSLFISDIRNRLSAFADVFSLFAQPLFHTLTRALSWAVWVVAPILTGMLAHATYLCLNPRDRAVAGLAGVLTTISLFVLVHMMSEQALIFVVPLAFTAFFGGLYVRAHSNAVLGFLSLVVCAVFTFAGLSL